MLVAPSVHVLSETTSTDRCGRVSTSTDSYSSAYSCTVSGRDYTTCVVPFLALSLVPL